ncbi:MAG: hypothetical protein HUU22_01720 [Phycisphaerae bacterium]|nr:hypothetical protein [Phycisphaerae bacterium]NUQ44733.1 hypothetical protein [Phycisphaerae bacterium]
MMRDVCLTAAAVILDHRVRPADVARRCGMSEREIVKFLRDAMDGDTRLGWDDARALHKAAMELAGLRAVTARPHSAGRLPTIERATRKAADPAWRERRIRELETRR